MKLLKLMLRLVIALCILVMFGFIAYSQWLLRKDFNDHWHHNATQHEVLLPEYKLSDRVPYNLTPPRKMTITSDKARSPESYTYWVWWQCGR